MDIKFKMQYRFLVFNFDPSELRGNSLGQAYLLHYFFLGGGEGSNYWTGGKKWLRSQGAQAGSCKDPFLLISPEAPTGEATLKILRGSLWRSQNHSRQEKKNEKRAHTMLHILLLGKSTQVGFISRACCIRK